MRRSSFGNAQYLNKNCCRAIAVPVAQFWCEQMVKARKKLNISFFCRDRCSTHISNCRGASSTKLYPFFLSQAGGRLVRESTCSQHVALSVHECTYGCGLSYLNLIPCVSIIILKARKCGWTRWVQEMAVACSKAYSFFLDAKMIITSGKKFLFRKYRIKSNKFENSWRTFEPHHEEG